MNFGYFLAILGAVFEKNKKFKNEQPSITFGVFLMRRGCSFGGFDALAGSGWSLGACLGTFWGVSCATLMITSATLGSLESMLNDFSQYAESKKQKWSQDGTTWLRKCSQKVGSRRGPYHPGIEILIRGNRGPSGVPSTGQRYIYY